MAAVQTAGRGNATYAKNGIRPFELTRDLRPVANLIADAFAHELDERGAAALREMQMMSRLGGLLGVLNMATGDFSDVLGGFVWVESGEVVGNITVQRADKYGVRWQIANVAVARAWRGRGISRRLMERAIDHIREYGGKWAVLQVYAENAVARTLYDHMGFEMLGGMTDFQADGARHFRSGASPGESLGSFAASEWQAVYDLANSQLGSLTHWWRPLRRSEFQCTVEQQAGEWLWQALGRRVVLRRCVRRASRFEAAAILTVQRWQGPHRLQLWFRPESCGVYEDTVVQWAQSALAGEPAWPLVATLPCDHTAGVEALQRWGFWPLRTLLTMRLAVNAD